MLRAEGYRVNYCRVPLTDGTAPKPRDFDAFYASASSVGPADPLIFTCQLGGGTTFCCRYRWVLPASLGVVNSVTHSVSVRVGGKLSSVTLSQRKTGLALVTIVALKFLLGASICILDSRGVSAVQHKRSRNP